MEENLKNLKKVEYLEEFCAAMENARIWIKRDTTLEAVYRKEEKVILRIQGKASSG